MHLPRVARAVALLGAVYAYGLLALLLQAWPFLFGIELPSLDWWQWLLAPLACGFLAILFEWLTERGAVAARGQNGERFRLLAGVSVIALLLLVCGAILYVARA